MSANGKYTVVVTSDRYGNETYGLELEKDIIAAVTDLDVSLVSRPGVTEDALIEAATGADALLVSTREAITRRVLENAPSVKVIARYGVAWTTWIWMPPQMPVSWSRITPATAPLKWQITRFQ